MREDFDYPICPICDEELENELYCSDCDKKWVKKEMDEYLENEWQEYIDWNKKQHPEWFE